MNGEQEGRAAELKAESLLRGANYWKKWDLTLEVTLKEVNLREEHGKAAVYSGQTSKIIGIAVTTTRISSGRPMRQ
jgi:hypothetical protein